MADNRMGEMFASDRYGLDEKDWTDADVARMRRYRGVNSMANLERFQAAQMGWPESSNIEDRSGQPSMGWPEYWYRSMLGEFERRQDYKNRNALFPTLPPVTESVPMSRDAGFYDVGFPPRGSR
jgi:hypothetical protein